MHVGVGVGLSYYLLRNGHTVQVGLFSMFFSPVTQSKVSNEETFCAKREVKVIWKEETQNDNSDRPLP